MFTVFHAQKNINILGLDTCSTTTSIKTTKKQHQLDNNLNSYHLNAELYDQRFIQKLDLCSYPELDPVIQN